MNSFIQKALLGCLSVIYISLANAQEYRVITKVNKHLSIVMSQNNDDSQAEELYGVLYDKTVKIPMIFHDYDITKELIFLYEIKSGELDQLIVGALNMQGNVAIPFEYDYIEENDNNTYLLSKEGRFGICTAEGKIIVPVEYATIEINNKLMIAKKESGSALYSTDGEVLVPFGDNDILVVDENEGGYAVKENGHYIVRFDEYTYILRHYNRVTPTLFAKQGEVSIRDYFAFLADQRENSTLSDSMGGVVPLSELIPDTNYVEEKLRPVYQNFLTQFAIDNGNTFITHELNRNRKEKYTIRIPMIDGKDMQYLLDFPVTGITREQAKLYSEWLTNVYHNHFYDGYYDCSVRFRLPTEQEWITIAEAGLSKQMRVNHVLDSVNSEGCMLYIYNGIKNCKSYDSYIKKSLGGGTTQILSMNTDWNGLFQLFGNVSEFTSKPGINKGGSYFHSAENANTGAVQKGEGPNPWLGFRLVAEIILN